jgi:hypothetical protein
MGAATYTCPICGRRISVLDTAHRGYCVRQLKTKRRRRRIKEDRKKHTPH